MASSSNSMSSGFDLPPMPAIQSVNLPGTSHQYLQHTAQIDDLRKGRSKTITLPNLKETDFVYLIQTLYPHRERIEHLNISLSIQVSPSSSMMFSSIMLDYLNKFLTGCTALRTLEITCKSRNREDLPVVFKKPVMHEKANSHENWYKEQFQLTIDANERKLFEILGGCLKNLKLSSLMLRGFCFDSKAEALASGLRQNKTLMELFLFECDCGDEALPLIQMLGDSAVKTYNFSGSYFSIQALLILFKVLSHSKQIEFLDLTAVECLELMNFLDKRSQSYLQAQKNLIPKIASQISSLIRSSLRGLYLNNFLNLSSIIQYDDDTTQSQSFAYSVNNPRRIQYFQFMNVDSKVWSETLQFLDLSYHYSYENAERHISLKPEDVPGLASFLSMVPKLKDLQLPLMSDAGPAAVEILMNALAKNNLEALSIACNFTGQGSANLPYVLQVCPTLDTLDLRGSLITSTAMSQFKDFLIAKPGLKSLSIDLLHEPAGDYGVPSDREVSDCDRIFSEIISGLKTLRSLTINWKSRFGKRYHASTEADPFPNHELPAFCEETLQALRNNTWIEALCFENVPSAMNVLRRMPDILNDNLTLVRIDLRKGRGTNPSNFEPSSYFESLVRDANETVKRNLMPKQRQEFLTLYSKIRRKGFSPTDKGRYSSLKDKVADRIMAFAEFFPKDSKKLAAVLRVDEAYRQRMAKLEADQQPAINAPTRTPGVLSLDEGEQAGKERPTKFRKI